MADFRTSTTILSLAADAAMREIKLENISLTVVLQEPSLLSSNEYGVFCSENDRQQVTVRRDIKGRSGSWTTLTLMCIRGR